MSERFGTLQSELWDSRILERFAPVFDLLEKADETFFTGNPQLKGELLHEFMLATDARYVGRGIGTGLVEASRKVREMFGLRGAVAEATGPLSQRIFTKLGYELWGEILYSEYSLCGDKVFASITSTPSCKLVGKMDY